jgi:maltose alpha-D-glucosyltransferase/alpha-amylase
MQWSDDRNGGFSTAAKKRLVRPMVSDPQFGCEAVNVDLARADEHSLLAWFERMLRSLRECPEFGSGDWSLLDAGHESVLALRYEGSSGRLVSVTNLSHRRATVDLSPEVDRVDRLIDVFGNRRYQPLSDLSTIEVDGYGYRWLRLR